MFSKLNTDDIMSIKTFEQSAGAGIIDCVCHDDTMYIVVSAKDMRKLAYDSGTLAKTEKVMDRHIKLIKQANNPLDYARNIMGPKAQSISLDNNVLKVKVKRKYKSIIIGREGRNIKVVEELLRRRFSVKKVVVA